MAFLPYPPNRTTEAVNVLNQDVQILHNIVHGSELVDIPTENGDVPTIAKLVQTVYDEVEAATGVDVSLRSDLAAVGSTVLVGGVEAQYSSFSISKIKDLATAPKVEWKEYSVTEFYQGTGLGGGRFRWIPSINKALHNGGTILDPVRLAAWDGTFTNIATLYTAGTGSGCFVRYDDYVTVDSFGAVGEADGLLDAVLSKMESVGIKNIVIDNRLYKTDNFVPATDALSFSGTGRVKIKSGQMFDVSICQEDWAGKGQPIRMAYTDVDWDWGTVSYLKSLGINTIMTFGAFDQANQLLLLRSVIAAKMNVMAYSNSPTASLPQLIDFYPNVSGYYLYDEPDASATPLATQNARISSYRAVTGKPIACSVAIDSEMQQLVSENFDIAFVQHYYTEGATSSIYATGSVDRNNIAKALHIQGSYQHKLPRTKLIPIIGLFTNASFTTNKNKLANFAKDVVRLSEDGSFGMFAWGGQTDPSNLASPKTDSDLLGMLKAATESSTTRSRIYVTPLVFASDNDFTGFSSLSAEPLLTDNATPLVKDVKLFSVNNVGSAVDEFNSTFHEQGIAAKNSGGYLLINLPSALCSGLCHGKFAYRNKVDSTNSTIGLSITQNYGYSKTDIVSNIMANNSSVYMGFSGAFVDPAIKSYTPMFRFNPASSNANHWKFIVGQFYVSNWIDRSY